MVGEGRERSGDSNHRSTRNPSKRIHDEASKESKSNAATGASAAGGRAIATQMMAFYFRAPAKAFFRTRVE